MPKYVDGFVLPVPKKNLEAYRKMAEIGCQVWREHGALEYVECVADDVKPGKLTSFPQAVLAEPEETVVFAWIVYPSREERDRINAAVFADPRLAHVLAHGPGQPVSFDGRRAFIGGFAELVRA